jgi:hypothetical protein
VPYWKGIRRNIVIVVADVFVEVDILVIIITVEVIVRWRIFFSLFNTGGWAEFFEHQSSSRDAFRVEI